MKTRTERSGSTTTEHYTSALEAEQRAADLRKSKWATAVHSFQSQNHYWMKEGVIYFAVQWTRTRGIPELIPHG